VKKIIRQKLANSKRRIERRLDKENLDGCSKPMMTANHIHYEIADRNRGMTVVASAPFIRSPAGPA